MMKTSAILVPARPSSDSLGAYLDQLKRYPIPGEEQQLSLCRRLSEARRRLQAVMPAGPAEEAELRRRDADYQGARQELALSHLRLVVRIARAHAHRGVALLDLVQEGNVGLLKAADLFNPDLGFRFSTYAKWWIRESVQSALASLRGPCTVPVRLVLTLSKLRAVWRALAQKLGRAPSVEEAADEAGIAPRDARRALRCASAPCSLDDGGPELPLAQLLADPRGAETVWSDTQQMLERRIRDSLQRLHERERRTLELRFGLNGGRVHSRRQAALLLELSQERVRQIETAALVKLRDPILAGDALQPFL